jgi:hypothetical protein
MNTLEQDLCHIRPSVREYIAEKDRRIAELAAALKEYGEHKRPCVMAYPHSCSCGLGKLDPGAILAEHSRETRRKALRWAAQYFRQIYHPNDSYAVVLDRLADQEGA